MLSYNCKACVDSVPSQLAWTTVGHVCIDNKLKQQPADLQASVRYVHAPRQSTQHLTELGKSAMLEEFHSIIDTAHPFWRELRQLCHRIANPLL